MFYLSPYVFLVMYCSQTRIVSRTGSTTVHRPSALCGVTIQKNLVPKEHTLTKNYGLKKLPKKLLERKHGVNTEKSLKNRSVFYRANYFYWLTKLAFFRTAQLWLVNSQLDVCQIIDNLHRILTIISIFDDNFDFWQ